MSDPASDGGPGPRASSLLLPDGWTPPRGYANGLVTSGRLITLAGQIGWNPVTCAFDAHDFTGQVRQALGNIVTLLRVAGAEPSHLVRLTWFITDRDAYHAAREPVGAAYREVIGRQYPPMSVVIVAGLIEPGALVEIEATAVMPA